MSSTVTELCNDLDRAADMIERLTQEVASLHQQLEQPGVRVNLKRLLELEEVAEATTREPIGMDCPWPDPKQSIPQRQNAFMDWVRGGGEDE